MDGPGGLGTPEQGQVQLIQSLFNVQHYPQFATLLDPNIDSTKPPAALNYVLFNTQNQIVASGSGAVQVNGDGAWGIIGTDGPIIIPENGYLSVFLTNRSVLTAVHFDDLRVTLTRGKLREEHHYYPHGLPMGHIGSSSTAVENRQKHQGNEYIQDLNLNWMDFQARQYDPQIGRFLGVDPLAEVTMQPYSYANNNPINIIDPTGMIGEDWRDREGNLMSSDQLKDVKVYIFYNPDGDGFSDQTMKQYAQYEKQYGAGSVALSNVMTESEFAQDWGDMAGSPDLVVMNHHGSDQQLHLNVDPDGNEKTLDGHYIVSTNSGKTNVSGTSGTKISDLPTPKANLSNSTMLLNTCNSNNPSSNMKPGTTLAKEFSKYVGTVRGTNKSINFNSSGNATTQWYYGGHFQFFQKGKQVENPAFKGMYDPQKNPGLKKPGEM